MFTIKYRQALSSKRKNNLQVSHKKIEQVPDIQPVPTAFPDIEGLQKQLNKKIEERKIL